MGKGVKDQINTGTGITNQQVGIASQEQQRSSADYAQMKSLIQPLITQQTDLANGNREAALSAAMPVISKLSSGWAGAKQNILNNMPAGAARDRAIADISTQMYTGMAGTQANLVREAPQTLAGVGQNLGGFSLQELGASLSGLQGGAQTNEGVLKAKTEQQKAWLNFFSSLASTAGGVATKGCWIAEAIYGVSDPRTFLVRAWLNGPYEKTCVGACVMRAYMAVGRQIARRVQKSRVLRAALKPLFDQALKRAIVFLFNPAV